MTGAYVVLGAAAFGVVLFLQLLVEISKDEEAGPKSAKYWPKFLFGLACTLAAVVAGVALGEGWRP